MREIEVYNKVDDEFTDDELNDFIEGIYFFVYTLDNLPYMIYRKTFKNLETAIYEGWGLSLSEATFGTVDYDFISSLRKSAIPFSSAKTYQQSKWLTSQIVDENGLIRPLGEFKKLVKPVVNDFNKNWLASEFETAKQTALSSREWQDIQRNKGVLPLLEYSTVGDERVRFTHRPLDKITLPVDHPFWDTHYPPNGWRCRCGTNQVDGNPTIGKLPEIEMEEMFKRNAGKDPILFTKDHPYFDQIPKGKLNQNFNLPTF